jgi:hypothetical protein
MGVRSQGRYALLSDRRPIVGIEFKRHLDDNTEYDNALC